MNVMRVGLVGCGNISPAYLRYLQQSSSVRIVACGDLLLEKAKMRAEEFGIESVFSIDEMMRNSQIELILNLTVPSAHAMISLAALEHGKHVYSEKPLAISLEDGQKMIRAAEAKGLSIGAAPDTFMGAGLQTTKWAIDNGMIGRPHAATAFMLGGGPERWHPNPEFFYAEGGGPLLDMGPYYLTALVQLLGPIVRVSGTARNLIANRTTQAGPNVGAPIRIETPTHYSASLDFAGGAIGTLVTSFDVPGGNALPFIEVYGSEGTLLVPDPNRFDGEVKLRRQGSENWETLSPIFQSEENERGRGLEEMVEAIGQGREPQASGKMAYHVLEVMTAVARSSEEGRHIAVESAEELMICNISHLEEGKSHATSRIAAVHRS